MIDVGMRHRWGFLKCNSLEKRLAHYLLFMVLTKLKKRLRT